MSEQAKDKKVSVRFLFNHPSHFFALGLGSGLAPRAPGTFGTIAAMPIAWLAITATLQVQLVLLLLCFAVGVAICEKTANDLGVHDHGAIVWDEFVGIWLTLLFVPASWFWWLLAFLVFRLFDIAKPWPIRYFDRQVGGGFGIMIDDVIAGLMAGLLLLFLHSIAGQVLPL